MDKRQKKLVKQYRAKKLKDKDKRFYAKWCGRLGWVLEELLHAKNKLPWKLKLDKGLDGEFDKAEAALKEMQCEVLEDPYMVSNILDDCRKEMTREAMIRSIEELVDSTEHGGYRLWYADEDIIWEIQQMIKRHRRTPSN